MKVSKEFILREIAGEHILVPIGTAAANFNGLISMNEVGRFLFDLLAEERTPQELADCVCGEYDVPPETALQDVENFLQQLREIGAMLEVQRTVRLSRFSCPARPDMWAAMPAWR